MRHYKLVAGLGNPGPEYERTRHNVGFMALDNLARRLKSPRFKRAFSGRFSEAVLSELDMTVGLLKPQTYMNRSGSSVARALRELKISTEDLLVINDDLDISPGKFKIKRGGGTAGHKGLESIKGVIGSGEFTRIRIGIGKPARGDTVDFVLDDFRMDEIVILENEVMPRVIEAVLTILKDGPEKAMNEFNK